MNDVFTAFMVKRSTEPYAEGHPEIRLGIGFDGEEPSAWLEHCGPCLAATILRNLYCCEEHALLGLKAAWLELDELGDIAPSTPPNRATRRSLARKKRVRR